MTRAVDLLRNKFGISQLYKHDVIKNDEVIFSVYWHPLTIAERESIQKKTGLEDTNDYALQLMIEKALDKDGARLFQDGDRASLRREVEAFTEVSPSITASPNSDNVALPFPLGT